jgi:hypothetical protein
LLKLGIEVACESCAATWPTYNKARTHLALGKDPPESRPVQAADEGAIVAVPEVGRLHHRYERRAAA